MPAITCFNPRPLLLTGESLRRFVNAMLLAKFQSTPVIANGRILIDVLKLIPIGHVFQSTPVIANGRIPHSRMSPLIH